MVKTRQMEKSMKHQDFHFDSSRVSKVGSIAGSNIGRDGNLAGM